MSTRTQALILALQSLQAYDQFGTRPNHKAVMRSILKSLRETEEDILITDPDLLIESSMLMTHAIEKAKNS